MNARDHIRTALRFATSSVERIDGTPADTHLMHAQIYATLAVAEAVQSLVELHKAAPPPAPADPTEALRDVWKHAYAGVQDTGNPGLGEEDL